MTEPQRPLRIAAVPEAFNDPFHEADFSPASHPPGAPELQLTPGGSGAMQKALESGQVDAAFMLTECIVSAIETGSALRLAGPLVTSPLTWAVCVSPPSPHQTLSDLCAARWGISRRGSGSHVMARLEASTRGWPSPRFVECANLAGLLAALAARDIDAFLWEHFTTKPHVLAGRLRFVGQVPTPWPCFSVAVRADCARGPEIRAAVDAFLSAAHQWRGSTDVAQRVAQRHGMQVDDAAHWADAVRYARPGVVALDEKTLLQVREALRTAGVIHTPPQGADDRGVLWYNADFVSGNGA